MTKLFDSVIGGRYIGFAMKAEGIAVLTTNTLYAEDIENADKETVCRGTDSSDGSETV